MTLKNVIPLIMASCCVLEAESGVKYPEQAAEEVTVTDVVC